MFVFYVDTLQKIDATNKELNSSNIQYQTKTPFFSIEISCEGTPLAHTTIHQIKWNWFTFQEPSMTLF